MIQRIQTLYLFIATIAIALTFIFPIAGYYGELHIYQLNAFEMKNMVPGEPSIFSSAFAYPISIFVVAIALICLFIILMFKNRKRQISLTKIAVLLNIILIIALFFVYSRMIQAEIAVEESFKTGAFLPLISLVFMLLAIRSIKKDDELIRSADRLR